MGRGVGVGAKRNCPQITITARARRGQQKNKTKKKLPSVIFLAIGMWRSGREVVSLSSSSFPTLFFGLFFFFFFSFAKKGANHAQYCLLRFIFLGRNFHLLSRAVNARLIAAIIPADK